MDVDMGTHTHKDARAAVEAIGRLTARVGGADANRWGVGRAAWAPGRGVTARLTGYGVASRREEFC